MHHITIRKEIYKSWLTQKNQSQTSRELKIPRRTIGDYYKKFSEGVYPNWQQGADSKSAGESPCGFESHHAYSYLYALGMYLGDGHISKMKSFKNGNNNYRLRIFLDSKYPDIIQRITKALDLVVPKSKVSQILSASGTCTIVYLYSNDLVKLFPQHGPGKKHNRKIELTNWQHKFIENNPKPFIKGLIESDGCRYINQIKKYGYPTYLFTNKSEDLHDIFTWSCNILGIRTKRTGKNTFISIRENVNKVDEFVGPKS